MFYAYSGQKFALTFLKIKNKDAHTLLVSTKLNTLILITSHYMLRLVKVYIF